MDVKDDQEARSNLTAKEQMELAEREAQLVSKPVSKSWDIQPGQDEVQPQKLQGGATSRVDRGATSEVAYNETLTSNINEYKDKARMLCVMFLRVADSYGTPRQYQERDEQMMLAWVRNGLTADTWKDILTNHIEYCKRNSKDMARGIGYFQEPVRRALGKSKNPEVSKLIQNLKRSLKA